VNAYVRARTSAAPTEGDGRTSSAADALRDFARGLTGPAPIELRGRPPPAAVVGLLIGVYGGALALFGPVASSLLAAPAYTAAIVLSGTLAMVAWLVGLAVTIAIVPIPELSRSGNGFDAPFVLASAVVLRAIVVVAISSRLAHARRDATLAREPEAAQTQQWAAQLGVLQAASARLSRASGVEAVGRAIVEETRKIIDYHNARVYVLEPGGDVVPMAFEGVVGAYEQVDFALLRCRLGQGFTGWVAQHGVPLRINDANADPRGANIPGTDDVDESMLVVPMSYDGQVVGVITLSKLGLNEFDEDDERLLLILADQAATALESARLLARSEALAGELRRLLDMSGQLAASLQTVEVANLIAMHLVNALDVDECAISYWDRPKKRLATLGYHPPMADLTPFFEIEGYPETQRVLDEQVAVQITVDDPAADPAEVALLEPEGYRSLVMLPLVAKGQSIGLVELLSRGVIDMGTERLELARTMSNEAAMALENARLYEEARALADRDQLTGFYNHRYFHERFGEEVIRAQRSKQPLSVLMLDLDDFKLVNDTFGHLFGDQVLAWTAEVIRSTLRASDIPARYGGDEFAILLPDTTPPAAARAAERIRDAFAAAAFEGGTRSPVAVSLAVGAATFPTDGRSPTELIAVADAALYVEKRREAEGSTPPRARSRRRSLPDQPSGAGAASA
jgi:diguanylate cyclase (GGDEF)-like protein